MSYRSIVVSGVLTWMCMAGLPLGLPFKSGQVPGPQFALAQADESFMAVVSTDKTVVRAGAGDSFYKVGELAQGTQVKIEKLVYGWGMIPAPRGAFSYISRAFVDAKGDGKTGLVNNTAAVIAASLAGTGDSYRRQLDLKKGDTVQIVAEEGSYYKIVPPAGASVFLTPGTFRRVGVGDAAATPVAMPPAVPPVPAVPTVPAIPAVPATPATPVVTPPATQPGAVTPATPAIPTVPVLPATPAIPTTPGEVAAPATPVAPAVPPSVSAFVGAETRFAEAMRKPLEEQPLDELLSSYQALAADATLAEPQRTVARGRMAQLRRNSELAAGLKALTDAKRQLEQPITPAAPTTLTIPAVKPAPRYDAVGQLQASAVYDGVKLPRLYRLYDPASRRTVAYIQPAQTIDPIAVLGKVVGIIGKGQYDPALKLEVFSVERLDVLEVTEAPAAPGTPATQPAAPGAEEK